MKKIYFYVTFALLALSACLKPFAPLYHLPQEARDYTCFGEGSYWIYQLENSTALDTVTIIKSNPVGNSAPAYRHTSYKMILYSTYYRASYIIMSTPLPPLFGEASTSTMSFRDCLACPKTLYYSGDSLKSNCFFGFYNDNEVSYISYFETYTLENKVYKDVKVFNSNFKGQSITDNDRRIPSKTFYAKNIGIIRKQFANNVIWSLVAHSVHQNIVFSQGS